MSKYIIEILEKAQITHDVVKLKCSKPSGLNFKPGQAVHLFVDGVNASKEKGAFTTTSLPMEHHLEFVIKIYPSHKGATKRIDELKVGDTVEMDEPYGYIHYESRGLFIAAGSGITPFICIFRDLESKGLLDGNRLIYANKTSGDIIYKEQLSRWFRGNNLMHILSEEETQQYYHGYIDKVFLENAIEDLTQKFYLCGPPEMMDSLVKDLNELGVSNDQIIAEGFE